MRVDSYNKNGVRKAKWSVVRRRKVDSSGGDGKG